MSSVLSPPDYTALTGRIPLAEFHAFVAAAKARGQDPESEGVGGDPAKGGMYSGTWGTGLAIVMIAFAVIYRLNGGNVIFTVIWIVVIGLVACLGLFVLAQYAPRFVRRWRLFYRATGFARDNGLEYLVQAPVPAYDGMIFHIPSSDRGANYVLRKQNSPVVEAGQLCYIYNVPNASKPTTGTQKWGYIVVELPVNVPSRVVLRSNAPASERALSLGFARKTGAAITIDPAYTLFSPPECEAVARQVFTPELLTHIRQLEDKFSPVNAELIGNHLYLFTLKKPFYMYKAADVRLVFDTIAAVRNS